MARSRYVVASLLLGRYMHALRELSPRLRLVLNKSFFSAGLVFVSVMSHELVCSSLQAGLLKRLFQLTLLAGGLSFQEG